MKNIILAMVSLACASGLVSTGTAAAVGTGASFKGPVGLQLYSLRDDFKKDVPGTLDLAKNFGPKIAELAGTYGMTPEQFKKELDKRGLKGIGAHFGFELWEKDPEAVAKDAKALGLKYAGCAWIPHEGKFTEADAHKAAAVFNKAGEALAKYGIKFYYHNHGYEFEPYNDGTLMDILVNETKPALVAFQMDVLWTFFPGQDPAKLLKRYSSRWELMHLKDLKKGVATGSLSGGTDVENDVVLGTGQIDLAATLKAAAEVGVKYYFIEDESSRSKEQIPQSLKFLEKVKW
jgi:sugar phosphate isomerase/epimerase